MEPLCTPTGPQNAKTLTGQADSIKLDQQCHAQKYNERDNLRNAQSTAGADDMSAASRPSVKGNKERTNSMRKSFADNLDEIIPKDSLLRRSITERKPSGLLINELYPSGCNTNQLDSVFLEEVRADSVPSGGTALIIQDVNQDWANSLCSAFPRITHSSFLAEHMIRIDSAMANDEVLERLSNEMVENNPDTKLDYGVMGSCKTTEFRFPSRPMGTNGFHIDVLIETREAKSCPSDMPFSHGPRRDVFEKSTTNHWRRTSTRLSWCQLDENLYLVLVDSTPGFDEDLSWASLRENPFRVLLDPRLGASKFWTQSRLAIQYAHWDKPTDFMKSIVSQLLQHHTVQSVFSPKAVPVNGSVRNLQPQLYASQPTCASKSLTADASSQNLAPGPNIRQLFVWLLTESTWQLAVTTLESKWQRVRLRSSRLPGDEAFVLLIGLRRQFADAQDLIAESKESCIQTIRETRQWRVDGYNLNADQFWSEKPSAPATAFFRHAQTQTMDIRDLPDFLQRMERRVAALTAAVNQEIQVVIGSVQVADARAMKRQTEWMVVLALLAAIYLPMTLVTGIFGMNISEINHDDSLPDRWSTVKVWGVVFGATVGCILIYAVARRPVRWVLEMREMAKNKALDLEALKIE